MRFIPCHWLLCLHQTFACNVTSHVSCICGGWRVLILFVALRKETTNVCWILLCVDKYDIIRHPLNVINPQHHHHCPWLLSRQCFIKFMCHRSIDLSGFATIHKACLSPPLFHSSTLLSPVSTPEPPAAVALHATERSINSLYFLHARLWACGWLELP